MTSSYPTPPEAGHTKPIPDGVAAPAAAGEPVDMTRRGKAMKRLAGGARPHTEPLCLCLDVAGWSWLRASCDHGHDLPTTHIQ
jgi:hypothetical protein